MILFFNTATKQKNGRGGETFRHTSLNTRVLHLSQRARRAPLERARQQRRSRDLLAPTCGWFTEGFGTLDLEEAKIPLDAVAHEDTYGREGR